MEVNKDSNDTNAFRYCGEYFDNETESIYLRARNYNPITGRFTSEDPAKDGFNWYAYCEGNPVAFLDPLGLKINLVKDKKDKDRSIRLKNLQALTDDKLVIDKETNEVKYIVARKINRYKGTFLLRDLINSKEDIDFVLDGADNKYVGSQCETIYRELEDGYKDTSEVEKYQVTLNVDSEQSYIMTDYYTGEVCQDPCPSYIILGHELIHAYRRINGIPDVFTEAEFKTYIEDKVNGGYRPIQRKERIEELETIGIDYRDPKTKIWKKAPHLKYTENALRRENEIGPRMSHQ